MKINIGSGYKKYEDFINLDGDKNCNPDILINLDDKNLVLPFEDNSIDYVLAEHILEHIGEGYFKLLQELYRICKPGAFLDIKVPHPNHEVYLNDPTHKRPITVEGIRLFSKKFNQYEIDRKGSSSTLGIMFDVDFELVKYDFVHDTFYQDKLKSMTDEQIERLYREALNTTIEIHMIVQVIK